jgi:hypothetical protein
MNRSRSAALVVTLALGAALAPGARASLLPVPAPSAEEVAAPPGEVTPPPPAAAVAAPRRAHTLEDDPPTDERTPAPTAAEWKTAPGVTLAREPPDCRAQRVREWLRISCTTSLVVAMDLLAGPREGVSFDHHPKGPEQAVVLPLRRGDRRVLQIVTGSWSKYTVEYDTAVSITEDWLDGAAAPTVVVN